MNKNKTRSDEDIKHNYEGKLISNSSEVANAFNHFFTSIAQKLAEKLGPAKANYRDFLKSPIKESFFINPVDEEEVKCEIMSLDDSKSSKGINSFQESETATRKTKDALDADSQARFSKHWN